MILTLKEYSLLKGIPYRTVSGYVSFGKLKPISNTGPRKSGMFLETALDDLFKNHKLKPQTDKPIKRRDRSMDLDSEDSPLAPFRNIKCPNYRGCMTDAATQKKSLICENCENRNAESHNWLENEMAC